LSVKDFSPLQLIDQIRNEIQPFADAKTLTVDVTIPDDFPAALIGDPSAIRAIILALIWNAISFTASGTIQIASEWDGAWLLRVSDTGPGISSDVAEHLFEPFQPGTNRGTAVPTSRCGMGLATAQALAQAMSGQLMLAETSTTGTSFDLRVPLCFRGAKS